MCLAIPAKIESLENDMATCRVGESETFITVSTMLMEEEPRIGDYLIVHAGFALRLLDPKEAQETLTVLRQLAEAEFGEAPQF